jgi:hypothetical protein
MLIKLFPLILFRISTATVITIVVIFITDHSHIKFCCCWVGEAEGLLLWLPMSDVRVGLLCGIAMRFELLPCVVNRVDRVVHSFIRMMMMGELLETLEQNKRV